MADRRDHDLPLEPEVDAMLDASPEHDAGAGAIHDPERPEPEADLGADVCRHLRTKMFYVKGPEGCDLTTTSTTAQYSCLRTHDVLGPDEAPVCPDDCKRGRGCFEEL